MTVQELIDELMKVENKEATVKFDTGDVDGGCSTCGYGGTEIVSRVRYVRDMDTWVALAEY